MNTSSLFSCMLLVAALVSCKDDDDPAPSHSFKDQELAGEIGGDTWTYEDGYASAESTDGVESLYISLVQDATGEGCDAAAEGDFVFFYIPKAVGVYELKLDWNDLEAEDNHTITLFDDENTMNYIAAEGALEILSITDTQVSGRIDAVADEDAFINGNFTVSICQ